MAHQILAIIVDSATAERVCSYAGLTISETQTCASLLDDTIRGDHVVQVGVSLHSCW